MSTCREQQIARMISNLTTLSPRSPKSQPEVFSVDLRKQLTKNVKRPRVALHKCQHVAPYLLVQPNQWRESREEVRHEGSWTTPKN